MLKEEIKNIPSSRSDLKKFGFTFGCILIILGIWFLIKNAVHYHLFIGGAGFILLALLAPVILKPLQRIWMILATVLGWFMTRLILSVLFYLILTPTALLAKLMRKQFLMLKTDKSIKSYWNFRDRSHSEASNLKEQF